MLARINWDLPWDIPQEVTAWEVVGYCICAAIITFWLTVMTLYAIDHWLEERKWRKERES